MHRTALLTLLLFAALALAHGYLAHTRTGVAPQAASMLANADDRDRQRFANPTKADTVQAEPPGLTEVAAIATPNHDARHRDPAGMADVPELAAAASPMMVRAEPVAAAPSIPAFVAADSTLYAKANARLRTAPSTASEIVTKLAANVRLHATARSTDGLWWEVPLGEQRTGYIHRDAVTTYRAAAKVPAAPPSLEPVPVVLASEPAAVPERRNRTPIDLVNNAIDWVVDVATHPKGPPPKAIRTER